MGALHDGHLSLIRRARAECDRVAVSIFINPRQFGAGEDYGRYPRGLERDLAVLAAAGVDVAYIPTAEAMYPPGHATQVSVKSAASTTLEAVARPGHFDGVALVVTKLFTAGRPDRAYLGEKDAQQCAVIRRLVADLDLGVEIVVCPTVRGADGLALSSRNAYLSSENRVAARALPEALAAVSVRHGAGVREPVALCAVARARLAEAPELVVEYVAIVNAETFEEAGDDVVDSVTPWCCVAAVRVGGTRLIDAARLPPIGSGTSESPALCETVRMSAGPVGGGVLPQCNASS